MLFSFINMRVYMYAYINYAYISEKRKRECLFIYIRVCNNINLKNKAIYGCT